MESKTDRSEDKNLEYSLIQLNDLSDEILLIILKKIRQYRRTLFFNATRPLNKKIREEFIFLRDKKKMFYSF
jgi:hypothetical protein